MTMPLDPEKARQLMEAGYLNQSTYENNFGTNTPVPTPTPAPAPAPAAATGVFGTDFGSAAPTMPSGLAEDPMMMARGPEGDAKKLAIDAQRQALEKRKSFAKRLGLSDAEIEAKINPIVQDLDAQERGLYLTGEKVTPQNVLLTTDLGAPQVSQKDMYPANPLVASYDLQQQAVGLAGAAGAAKAAEQSSAMKTAQNEMAELQKKQESARVEEQAQLQQKQTELQTEVERVSQLKVDPGRFWADKSTEGKIILGASLFLGAFGAAQTGVNQAAKMIDQAIDRDIRIQQQNIAQETAGLSSKKGLFAEFKNRFKDNDLARSAAKMAYLQDAQMNIERIAKKYESKEIEARAMQMIGALEAQKQQLNADYMSKVQTMIAVDPNADPNALPEEQRVRFVKGYGLAQKSEYADVANKELIPETKSINDSLDRLLAISNQPGGTMNPATRAEANTQASFLIGKLRLPVTGPGAMSDGERKLLEELIANPTKVFSLDAANKKRLQTLKQKVNFDLNAKLYQLGLPIPEYDLKFKPLD